MYGYSERKSLDSADKYIITFTKSGVKSILTEIY